MQLKEIAFATIGKDGKDDHCVTASPDENPAIQAPEIAFATIGKDGKDDTRLTTGTDVETPELEAQTLQF